MLTSSTGKRALAFFVSLALLMSGFGGFVLQTEALAAQMSAKEQAEAAYEGREVTFNDGWKFYLVDKYDISKTSEAAPEDQVITDSFDDAAWDTVTLPHDWAIYNDFENGNGVRAAQGALAGGVGWYRKSFTLPEDMKDKDITIQFDGVQMISQVWVNGHTEDNWKQYLGYNTFQYDITKYLKFNGEENVIAVKVQSANNSARWYAGAGIYRNVYLITTEKIHVPVNGVFVKTPLEKLYRQDGTNGYEKLEKIENPSKAGVDIETELANGGTEPAEVTLRTMIYNKAGNVASKEDTVSVAAGTTQKAAQSFEVPQPQLWSTDSPNLYWAKTEVISGGKVVDTTETRFGIRYMAFDSNSGFYLSGVRTQLNGTCEHSDLGALGMEVYQAAIDRRIRKLKSMGVNAVRTAHNPVSPEYIEACDRLGMLVFEEAFDQWLRQKNGGDYSHYFNKAADGTTVVFDRVGNDTIEIKRDDLVSNAERDIKAMVDRDKNAPCIFAWSTGNEIYDSRYKDGMDTLKMLTGWIKSIDDTRAVAACPPTWDNYNANDRQQEKYLAAADISGFNYGTRLYDGAHERNPNMVIFGSETVSAHYSRGVYDGTSAKPNGQCSDYPLSWTFSSATDSLIAHRDRPYAAGEFIWTGHD